MVCSRPPAISDEQLLSWIDGDMAGDVAEHVQQCAYCRARGEQLARLQQQLAAQLYRVVCPPPLELGEYHLGVLAPDRVATVEKHLAECLHCAREVQDLQGYLHSLATELAPAPEQKKPAKKPTRPTRRPAFKIPTFNIPPMHSIVAKLVDHVSGLGVGGGPTPTFAALRGEPENQDVRFVYEAADVQIIIELQAEPTQPDRKVLLGLILGLEADQTVEARLQQADQAPLTAPVDELGNFIFDQLTPGTYTLLLHSAESEIRIEALKV